MLNPTSDFEFQSDDPNSAVRGQKLIALSGFSRMDLRPGHKEWRRAPVAGALIPYVEIGTEYVSHKP